MKNPRNLFLAIMMLMTALVAKASEQYEKSMITSIKSLYEAKDAQGIKLVITQFEEIADSEREKWEPKYYTALGYILLSQATEMAEEKDQYLDQAISQIRIAKVLSEGEDELEVLAAYALMSKITVNPFVRGQEYSGQVFQVLQKAIQMDEDNPRAWFLLGQMQLGMSKFMGAGTEAGCASIQKAVSKFENEKKESPLAPDWGAEEALTVSENCGK